MRIIYNDVTGEDEKESVFNLDDLSQGLGDGGASGSGTPRCNFAQDGHYEIGSRPDIPHGGILTPPPVRIDHTDFIKYSMLRKSARVVFNAFMGPPKKTFHKSFYNWPCQIVGDGQTN